jgi:predicted cupin superfamily sugar epimerase
MDLTAQEIITRLSLQPHPEGGWFRETWREPAPDSPRGLATAIHFLLKPGERSHWHRIDAAELWLHQGGGPLRLKIVLDGQISETRLGPDLAGGERLQVLVPAGAWQAAEPLQTWSLAACIVAPAFSFESFELAPPGFDPMDRAPGSPDS